MKKPRKAALETDEAKEGLSSAEQRELDRFQTGSLDESAEALQAMMSREAWNENKDSPRRPA